MDKRLIGKLGEKLVCKWYTDRRYELLSVNYRTRFGEIDIIAQNKNYIVFIEVKTRKDASFTQAREYVDKRKQQRIKTAAASFLAHQGLDDMPVRFDVAEVYNPENKPVINIIENAFE
ncbi:MAG: YraN family protein [Oscillospiraceae bacterium]|nr:YraN family protein [Oscillospiraceae bacterium]